MSFRIFLKYKYTQKYKDFTGLSKIIIFADPDGTTFCGMKHGNVKIEKTNAARLLDRAKIAYELIPYRVDEEHLAATHGAEQLGEDVAAVFKTLVLRGDRTGHFVCVVPGDHEVDLKAAARISGNKKADLIRYFSLGAGLVSPLSAGREMPYRTARIRMRITEQAAMNCVGAAGRSRYIQR